MRRGGLGRRPLLRDALLALLVALAAATAFQPALGNGFLSYDDEEYVLANPAVRRGLDLEGVRWAFATVHADNWHPLTWLSHMLDVSLFGLSPAGHHATSVALHAAAAVLLFLFLRAATGTAGSSAAVAVLFAVHPTRVESVAWVAERKDVLCALFAFLALLAWTGYVRRPSPVRYAAAAAFFALGLLSKPMLVTLPVLLLVLDLWPYGRWSGAGWQRCLEKVPLLLLSAASAAVTLLAQGHARAAMTGLPIAARVANAAIATVQYLAQLAWPARLAVLYPHPGTVPAVAAVGCAALVLLLTAAAWWQRRSRPWLLVGWLWFLVGLVPVIGLVQVGLQARADRYTYLPAVGVFIAASWSAAEWAARAPWRRTVAVAALLLLAALATARTRSELRHWHDSIALFSRALELTGPANPMAQYGLAHALSTAGRGAEAIPHFAAALRLRPDFELALDGGAQALLRSGRVDEATQWYEGLVRRQPRSAVALYNLAELRIAQGDLPDATHLLQTAAAIDPRVGRLRHDLGIALLLAGDDAAGSEWLRHAALAPGAPEEWRVHFEESRERRAGRPAPVLSRYLVESRLVLAEGLARRGLADDARLQLSAAALEAAPDQQQRIRAMRPTLGPPAPGAPGQNAR